MGRPGREPRCGGSNGQDLHLLSLKINGEEVDPKRVYRIATLDYVAEGNDRMVAFKSKTDVKNPGGKRTTCATSSSDISRKPRQRAS